VVPPRGNGQVETPNSNDVLSGRGGKINSFPGNVRFRDIVSEHKHAYKSNDALMTQKARIAQDIVHQIRTKYSGRFLKQDPDNNNLWYDIGDQKAIIKVEQALREAETRTSGSAGKHQEYTTSTSAITSQPILSSATYCTSSSSLSASGSESCCNSTINCCTNTLGQEVSPKKKNMAVGTIKNHPRPKVSIVVPPRGIGPVDEPNPNDVLSGRGYKVNIHPGNVQFREFIARRKQEYIHAHHPMDKTSIAASIVHEIRHEVQPPGRFLKYESVAGTCGGGSWYDIGDEHAIKKVGQALREDAPAIRNSSSSQSVFIPTTRR
jgi:hypothetical protein